MMPERDGLCALQMRVARHNGVGIFLRLVAQYVDELF